MRFVTKPASNLIPAPNAQKMMQKMAMERTAIQS